MWVDVVFSYPALLGCGCRNRRMGGSKVHRCRRRPTEQDERCPLFDRDCGSARAILLRHLHKYVRHVDTLSHSGT